MLWHFTNLSLHSHIFYKDKERKKIKKKQILEQVPLPVGVFFNNAGVSPWPWPQACCSRPGALRLSLCLDRGRRKGWLRSFSFCFFTSMMVHSSLVYAFIFHWCEGVQSLSKRNHRQLKGAKREKRNGPAWPFFGTWNCLRLIAHIRRITVGA